MTQVRRWRAAGAGGVVLSLIGLASAPARAQAEEGTVVAVEKDDLVVDLGTDRGAANGATVEIWHPLHLKHPVTGKLLTDRFLIGRLQLSQARPKLSLAKAQGELARLPEAGDVVILGESAAASPSTSTSPPTSPSTSTSTSPATSMDEDAKRLSEVFDSLRGADIATRIHAYGYYVNAHPQSRYARVLWEEARALRQQLVSAGARTAEPLKPAGPVAQMDPVARAVAREPLRMAVAIHGDVSGAVLHVRTTGEPTYQSEPMAKVGTEYWAAVVPAGKVENPGLDFFIEAVSPDGTHPVVGDPTAPRHAEVEDVLPRPPSKVLGQAQVWTDYASFNVKNNNDYLWQTEGFMGARIDDVGIRAVRMGGGVYRGVGGSLRELDQQGLAPRSVGLTYGYLETEFGFSRNASLGVRGVVGLQEGGVTGGALSFFRIGSDLGTNLWFGGEVLGGIGLRGITQFEWNSFPRWPIVLRTEVTNQPAGVAAPQGVGQASEAGDVGARAIAQVGYRVLPHLVVSVRGSYQGRTINHAGPGAGGAVAYAW